jgi:peptidyl-tRNA hydrolase, PTH1 family
MNDIKAIIGLGNIGPRFSFTRHNAGFLVVDALADRYYGTWQQKGPMEIADITIADHRLLLIKPQTYMNESGKVIPLLSKQGIKPENILVVHDELEKPFGTLAMRTGGSHRGHNGLRSIIAACGPEFQRLRFGIGRPERKEDVSNYVLQKFDAPESQVHEQVDQAVDMIERAITSS